MLKGSISLDSLITDHDLLQRISTSTQVVLYDSCSNENSTRPELTRFAEIFCVRFENVLVNILNGEWSSSNIFIVLLATSFVD